MYSAYNVQQDRIGFQVTRISEQPCGFFNMLYDKVGSAIVVNVTSCNGASQPLL
jgi:hypothetical protein